MINYKLKAAPTAVSKEQNSRKEAKANRILIGADVHLKSYQAAHKIDNGAVEVAQTFGSKEALLLYAQKQQKLAKEVVSDAYLASCAVEILTCRIGGCLVPLELKGPEPQEETS